MCGKCRSAGRMRGKDSSQEVEFGRKTKVVVVEEKNNLQYSWWSLDVEVGW